MLFGTFENVYALLKYSNVYSGALNLTHEPFHTTVAPTVISTVGCVGIENSLTDCFFSTLTTCGPLNDAGVVCQGILS